MPPSEQEAPVYVCVCVCDPYVHVARMLGLYCIPEDARAQVKRVCEHSSRDEGNYRARVTPSVAGSRKTFSSRCWRHVRGGRAQVYICIYGQDIKL